MMLPPPVLSYSFYDNGTFLFRGWNLIHYDPISTFLFGIFFGVAASLVLIGCLLCCGICIIFCVCACFGNRLRNVPSPPEGSEGEQLELAELEDDLPSSVDENSVANCSPEKQVVVRTVLYSAEMKKRWLRGHRKRCAARRLKRRRRLMKPEIRETGPPDRSILEECSSEFADGNPDELACWFCLIPECPCVAPFLERGSWLCHFKEEHPDHLYLLTENQRKGLLWGGEGESGEDGLSEEVE